MSYRKKGSVGGPAHSAPSGCGIGRSSKCGRYKSAQAQKLMAVMSLGVKKGETVTVTVEGDDEETAAADLEKFFRENL